jgi:hypothetical protein
MHRNNFDHAVRNTGLHLVEVESKEQLYSAISDRTAMLYLMEQETISIEECLAEGRPDFRLWSTPPT